MSNKAIVCNSIGIRCPMVQLGGLLPTASCYKQKLRCWPTAIENFWQLWNDFSSNRSNIPQNPFPTMLSTPRLPAFIPMAAKAHNMGKLRLKRPSAGQELTWVGGWLSDGLPPPQYYSSLECWVFSWVRNSHNRGCCSNNFFTFLVQKCTWFWCEKPRILVRKTEKWCEMTSLDFLYIFPLGEGC